MAVKDGSLVAGRTLLAVWRLDLGAYLLVKGEGLDHG
jgi:hypothetical protein